MNKPLTIASALGEPSADNTGERLHLVGLRSCELRQWLADNGHAAYHADQIFEWVHQKGVESFDAMTNISKDLRAWLDGHAVIGRASVSSLQRSEDGTAKLLLRWPDGRSVETVWIPEPLRHTACVSSQVGCPVGCRFCASGLEGVERDLTAGEIVEQTLAVRRLILDTYPAIDGKRPPRLRNIVFMGMGEPLANYDAVVQAIRIIHETRGLNIGARKITLSTVGLPKQIRRLATENLPMNLALSLHAPNDGLRRELIPWGKIPIAELLDACDAYFRETGREITLEYILLAGVNTEPEHARELAAICRRLRCNVNLLRYNPVPGLPYERPSAGEAIAFQRHLQQHGVNAHMRRSRGRDIDAACGQLRRHAMQGKP